MQEHSKAKQISNSKGNLADFMSDIQDTNS